MTDPESASDGASQSTLRAVPCRSVEFGEEPPVIVPLQRPPLPAPRGLPPRMLQRVRQYLDDHLEGGVSACKNWPALRACRRPTLCVRSSDRWGDAARLFAGMSGAARSGPPRTNRHACFGNRASLRICRPKPLYTPVSGKNGRHSAQISSLDLYRPRSMF
jgi:hypothetical protein